MDERKKGETKNRPKNNEKLFFWLLKFLLEKSEERGSTRNFTKSFKIKTVISHTNDFLKPEKRKKNKKGRKRKNEDVTLTNLLKNKT